jgi:hypothetical protein
MSAIQINRLTLGTIIRIWHDCRGHDYVFCGIDKDKNQALLLRSNCINNDGSIRSNTTKFHKAIPVSKLGDKSMVVRRVSRVCGERTVVDPDIIQKFAESRATNVSDFTLPKKKTSYTCSPNNDSRSAIIY